VQERPKICYNSPFQNRKGQKLAIIELYGSEGFPYIDQSWDEAEQDAANVMELLE
jgi:hypothetical protein